MKKRWQHFLALSSHDSWIEDRGEGNNYCINAESGGLEFGEISNSRVCLCAFLIHVLPVFVLVNSIFTL